MTEKQEKDQHNQDLSSNSVEGDVFTDRPNDDTFSQLQDDFNSLIAKTSDETPSSYEEPADAFNDLADAFAIPEDPTNQHLESDDNATESISSEANTQASIDEPVFGADQSMTDPITIPDSTEKNHDDLAFLEPLSHLDDTPPLFDHEEFHPISDTLSSDNTPLDSASTEQQAASLFDHETNNETPVFADLSSPNGSEERPKSHIIAIVSVIIIATVSGIYWYTMGSTKPETVSSETADKVSLEPSGIKKSKLKQSGIQQPAVPTPASAQSSPSVQTNLAHTIETQAVPSTLSTSDAIALLTAQKKTSQPHPTDSHKSIKLSAPTKKLASTDYRGGWVVVAPVDSKIIARQYESNFKSKGISSDILHGKHKGKHVYFIRIKGFSDQDSAAKQRHVLTQSAGLKNVTVFKETTKLTIKLLFSRQLSFKKIIPKVITPQTTLSHTSLSDSIVQNTPKKS